VNGLYVILTLNQLGFRGALQTAGSTRITIISTGKLLG